MRIAGTEVEVVRADVVVVGTGSAGYCAADHLSTLLSSRRGQTAQSRDLCEVSASGGVSTPSSFCASEAASQNPESGRDRAPDHWSVIMITDKINAGTSRNAGSDKQTYYKLTLAGDGADSVADMAETLFAGGAMDGDIALVEAAWSARAFFHLVDAGVPFPHDDYGQYVGYKTDHDPRQRATSVGPYTSKSMVEHLAARVEAAGVPVMEGYRVVDLLTMPCHAAGQSQDADRHFARSRRIQEDGEGNTPRHIVGLLTWKIDEAKYVLFSCDAVVYATGGPAGMYADSVYPHGQWGAQGAALRAGAKAKNLTEWQFGLASLRPRWNVSGSYMQVIPRFISTDATGGDEREFLADSIKDTGVLSSLVFLKGYQWPFDSRKAQSGSSLIDLLVYRETVQRGRRVYLDFRTNPMGYGPELLSEEARVYLDRAGVLHKDTPIARLRGMNEPAYQFYLERNPGLDLEKDLLEIAVCAQHNNGGLAADSWWQSNIEGFFPVGEAAGAHGVYRPGGAALNSGQVGATRAATWIAEHLTASSSASFDFADLLEAAVPLILGADSLMERATDAPADEVDADDLLAEAMRRMSDQAGLVRTPAGISTALAWVKEQLASLDETPPRVDPTSRQSLDRLFLLKDVLTSQYVYLSAMADYLNHGGKSRGSVLYTDADGYLPTLPDGTGLDLPEDFRFSNDNGALDDVIQETAWTGPEPTFDWRPRRPIPTPEDSFEKVWKTYRESR